MCKTITGAGVSMFIMFIIIIIIIITIIIIIIIITWLSVSSVSTVCLSPLLTTWGGDRKLFRGLLPPRPPPFGISSRSPVWEDGF
jgi:hypothetical protein